MDDGILTPKQVSCKSSESLRDFNKDVEKYIRKFILPDIIRHINNESKKLDSSQFNTIFVNEVYKLDWFSKDFFQEETKTLEILSKIMVKKHWEVSITEYNLILDELHMIVKLLPIKEPTLKERFSKFLMNYLKFIIQ